MTSSTNFIFDRTIYGLTQKDIRKGWPTNTGAYNLEFHSAATGGVVTVAIKFPKPTSETITKTLNKKGEKILVDHTAGDSVVKGHLSWTSRLASNVPSKTKVEVQLVEFEGWFQQHTTGTLDVEGSPVFVSAWIEDKDLC